LDRVPQQRKDEKSDMLDRGKHLLSEKYFPTERRDPFIFRAKKVLDSLFHGLCKD